MTSLLRGISSRFTNTLSSPVEPTGFRKVPHATQLFPKTDPAVDGEECLHDCESCTIKYPRKFECDENEELYGHVNGWSTHLVVATGKTDWVRDIEDEKGSVMEAVGQSKVKPTNGVRCCPCLSSFCLSCIPKRIVLVTVILVHRVGIINS